MTASTSEGNDKATPGGPQPPPTPPAGTDPDAEGYRFLSYEGAVVPRFIVVLWAVFLIFMVVYLIRYIPESFTEWFSRE